MKKIFLTLTAAALAVTLHAQDKAGTAVTPANNANPATISGNTGTAEFKFDVEVYDFGTIKQGESVSYDFKFSNAGKDPLIISEAHGSCGCTVPVYPKEPIKKGDTGVIKVTFNSTGKQGMQDKTVTITSNASGGQKVLHIKGNVEAAPAATAPGATPVQATPVPAEKK